jgi:hypothetical protein
LMLAFASSRKRTRKHVRFSGLFTATRPFFGAKCSRIFINAKTTRPI